MKTLEHFKNRIAITDPDVIAPTETPDGRVSFQETVARGKFWRVKPTTAKEVLFVQMLEHRCEKFAPRISADTDKGEGILISEAAMAKIDA